MDKTALGDANLKAACIKGGGSVVEYSQSFACPHVPGAVITKPEGQ